MKITPTKVRAAKLQNAPKVPINFWQYMKLLANPKLHSQVKATVKGYSSPLIFVGRISAMTVQAMAPKPIMKVKMMTMMERRGSQDQ